MKTPTGEHVTMSGPATYRIVVRGAVDPSWSGRLGGMAVSQGCVGDAGAQTVLFGRLPDQAALSSVLNTLYELHYPVISAECLESE